MAEAEGGYICRRWKEWMEGQEGNRTRGTNWSLSHGFECGTRGLEPIGFQHQHSGSVVSGTISVTFTRCPESPSAVNNEGGGVVDADRGGNLLTQQMERYVRAEFQLPTPLPAPGA